MPDSELRLIRIFCFGITISSGVVAAALIEPSAMHIDVAALLESFLRGFRRRGGELATKANPLMRDCIEAAVILSGRFED